MLKIKIRTNGHALSHYFRALIERAPVGCIIDVYSVPGPSPVAEFYEIWFDELEAWPDEKT